MPLTCEDAVLNPVTLRRCDCHRPTKTCPGQRPLL